MDTQKFNKIIEERIEKCRNMLCKKADEYATEDRLHTFKVAAELQNCSPEEALAGMMAKHTVSVYDMINDIGNGYLNREAVWEEKIGDSINYLLLLTALLEERFNYE